MNTYFAQVIDGRVQQVIVADQAFVDSGAVGDPQRWISTPRRRSAAPGDIYDAQRDAFIPPQPFASWTLDETTCEWQAPVPRPEGFNRWDEATQAWVEMQLPV